MDKYEFNEFQKRFARETKKITKAFNFNSCYSKIQRPLPLSLIKILNLSTNYIHEKAAIYFNLLRRNAATKSSILQSSR
jgi:hypothetical protein